MSGRGKRRGDDERRKELSRKRSARYRRNKRLREAQDVEGGTSDSDPEEDLSSQSDSHDGHDVVRTSNGGRESSGASQHDQSLSDQAKSTREGDDGDPSSLHQGSYLDMPQATDDEMGENDQMGGEGEGEGAEAEEEDKDEEVTDEQRLASAIVKIMMERDVSEAAIEHLFKLFCNELDTIQSLLSCGTITSSFKGTLKRHAISAIVPIKNKVKFVEHVNGESEVKTVSDLPQIPQSYFVPTAEYATTILWIEAATTLDDIRKHYLKTHRDSGIGREVLAFNLRNMQLGYDGVRQAHKTPYKLVVATVKLGGCLYVWKVWTIRKAHEDAKQTLKEFVEPLVDEILSTPNISCSSICADMLERHFLLGMTGHSGYYSCERCRSKGINAHGAIRWPYPKACLGLKRQASDFNNCGRPGFRPRGLVEKSPLTRLPEPFDIANNVALDEFHLCKEGVTKRLLEPLLKSKSRECRDLQNKLALPLLLLRVFSETPRSVGHIKNVGEFKGSEWGTLMFTVLPYLSTDEAIPSTSEKWKARKKAMAIFAFLTRAYFYDDDRLADIEKELEEVRDLNLKTLHAYFYLAYQRGYFSKNTERGLFPVPPNIHTFYHLLEDRRINGPLWRTTSEPYESLYATLKRLYKSGTRNVPRQILTNFYLRDRYKHSCRERRKLVLKPDGRSARKSTRVRDSYISTAQGCFVIISVEVDADLFNCHPIVTEPFRSHWEELALPWEKVGVHKMVGIDRDTTVQIHRDEVVGKFMCFKDILAEWQAPWLRDSKMY